MKSDAVSSANFKYIPLMTNLKCLMYILQSADASCFTRQCGDIIQVS